MKSRIKINKDERWMIVENLLNSYYALEDSEEDHEDLLEDYEDLLDKLSPNWREADSCKEVEVRESLEVVEHG